MDWWHWVAAGVAALMVLVLVLLRMDTARERGGPGAWRSHSLGVLAVPVAFAVVLFSPLWLALLIIAVPALAIAVLALAS